MSTSKFSGLVSKFDIDLTVKVIGRQWYWSYEIDEFTPSLDEGTRIKSADREGDFIARLTCFLFERDVNFSQSQAVNKALETYNFDSTLNKSRLEILIQFLTDRISKEELASIKEKCRWIFDSVLSIFNWETNKLNAFKLRLLDCEYLVMPVKRNVQFFVTSDDVIHSFAVPSAGIKVDALPGRLNSVICAFFRDALLFGQCSEICGIGHGFMPISLLILVESFLAYTVSDSAEITLAIVERYKMAYRHVFTFLRRDEIEISTDHTGPIYPNTNLTL